MSYDTRIAMGQRGRIGNTWTRRPSYRKLLFPFLGVLLVVLYLSYRAPKPTQRQPTHAFTRTSKQAPPLVERAEQLDSLLESMVVALHSARGLENSVVHGFVDGTPRHEVPDWVPEPAECANARCSWHCHRITTPLVATQVENGRKSPVHVEGVQGQVYPMEYVVGEDARLVAKAWLPTLARPQRRAVRCTHDVVFVEPSLARQVMRRCPLSRIVCCQHDTVATEPSYMCDSFAVCTPSGMREAMESLRNLKGVWSKEVLDVEWNLPQVLRVAIGLLVAQIEDSPLNPGGKRASADWIFECAAIRPHRLGLLSDSVLGEWLAGGALRKCATRVAARQRDLDEVEGHLFAGLCSTPGKDSDGRRVDRKLLERLAREILRPAVPPKGRWQIGWHSLSYVAQQFGRYLGDGAQSQLEEFHGSVVGDEELGSEEHRRFVRMQRCCFPFFQQREFGINVVTPAYEANGLSRAGLSFAAHAIQNLGSHRVQVFDWYVDSCG